LGDAIERLLAWPDASVRWLARRWALGEPEDAPGMAALRAEIPASPWVQALLSERKADGAIPRHPYNKWRGAHWVLAMLAELGYPPGDSGLRPLLTCVYGWLRQHVEHPELVPCIEGRWRRCASQEANAVWYALRLGLADEFTAVLVQRLLSWQWPDGGWNCDRRPEAHNSSYHESWLPLRALALYADATGDAAARAGADRAAEVLLKRQLYLGLHSGQPIATQWTRLAYPAYWHYGVLPGLLVMAESGHLADPRCSAALALLEARRLPDGGFPLERRYWRGADGPRMTSLANWGEVDARHLHPLVTIQALYVLRVAGLARPQR